jgi:hypothetical protein
MQNKTMDANKGRQYDFKFMLVLLCVLGGLLKITLSFPMSGSYGGVENQWYVSPALFPLVLLILLILCCLSLLVTAIKQGGAQEFLSMSGWLGNKDNQQVRERWLIIALLIAYVYVYIPSTDFYLATGLFVSTLTSVFYLKLARAKSVVIVLNSMAVLGLILIRSSLNQDPSLSLLDINANDQSILWCDVFTTCVLASIISWQALMTNKSNRSKFGIQLVAVLIVPLLLIIAFSFLLFVPMPVEYGSVINVLNWLAYEQLGL